MLLDKLDLGRNAISIPSISIFLSHSASTVAPVAVLGALSRDNTSVFQQLFAYQVDENPNFYWLSSPVSDIGWQHTRLVLNNIVQGLSQHEVTPNLRSVEVAMGLVSSLEEMGLHHPYPYVDGDGNVILFWKTDDERVFSLISTESHISLMVTRAGTLEYASEEFEAGNGIPVEIWNNLTDLTGSRVPYILRTEAMTSNIFRIKTMFDALFSFRKCIEVPLKKLNTSDFRRSTEGLSLLSGQSTHPLLLIHTA